MNCQDIARILDEREVDGLLPEDHSDAQAHIATCGDCARDWQIHAQLSGAEIPAVPAELRALYSRWAGGVSDASGRRRSRLVVIGTLVAVAAAAAMLVLQVNRSPAPVAATVDPLPMDPVVEEPSPMRVFGEALTPPTEPVSEDESKALEEWTQRVADWLAARDDPDALIAAAMLLRAAKPDVQRIRLLFQRATALAPENARIQAAAMLLCASLKPCDTTPYEQALRRLAPDNALGWVEEVRRASQADDQEAFQSALAAMSRTKTWDLYRNASIVSMASQISAALVPPPDTNGRSLPTPSHVVAVGTLAAMPIPAFQPIIKHCKSTTDERALLECRQIGAAMRAGDTLFVNTLGLTLSGYGLSADSAEARSLAQERNQISWVNREANFTADEPGFLGLLADHPREIDTYRAFLEERGIPTQPPADWKP